MGKLAKEVYSKAAEVLFNDKTEAKKLESLVSGDIFYVLRQYFEMYDGSFVSKIYTDSAGDINISLGFKAKRMLFKREFLTE